MTTALAALVLAVTAGSADPDLRGQAQAIVTKGGYQTALPGGTPAVAASPPTTASGQRPTGGRRARVGAPGLSTLPAAFLWPLLAVVGIAILAFALRSVLAAHRAREVPGRKAGPSREASPARRGLRLGPLTDVEDLARQGRYGEAIHLLLLHLFAALQRRPATASPPAHTGREVLARTRLAGPAREALGVLVAAAERIHFGGREASREDYDACLGHYRRFLESFERAGT